MAKKNLKKKSIRGVDLTEAQIVQGKAVLEVLKKADKSWQKIANIPRGAVRFNKGKTELHLLPSRALIAIAKGMNYGAKKYPPNNYKMGKGLNWKDCYNSLMRHMLAWNDGEDIDSESGLPHPWLAGCNIVMLIELMELKKGKDYRTVL